MVLSANAFVIDWNKIVHWAGSGNNKAALVVQFADNGPEEAYVWGYRWNDGQTPSGEDMFRAIAKESSDLTLFTQFTGIMGSTVCGIGYSDGHTISDFLEFDFDGAKSDSRVSFNYFSANTSMGQTSVPGWDTPDMCDDAIATSKTAHILEHPINARAYGYAAYDYDWWQVFDRTDADHQRWNAGWYDGYWSYWVGGVDSDNFSYSGLGMTSRKLKDGDVDGWKFQALDGPVVMVVGGRCQQNALPKDADASTGASTQWHNLNYVHFSTDGVGSVESDNGSSMVEVFNLEGMRMLAVDSSVPASEFFERLEKGVYIVRSGKVVRKVIKK